MIYVNVQERLTVDFSVLHVSHTGQKKAVLFNTPRSKTVQQLL